MEPSEQLIKLVAELSSLSLLDLGAPSAMSIGPVVLSMSYQCNPEESCLLLCRLLSISETRGLAKRGMHTPSQIEQPAALVPLELAALHVGRQQRWPACSAPDTPRDSLNASHAPGFIV